MAYNNFLPNYQPLFTPQATPQSEIHWVQGEAGAKSYLVAPNQTVTLWDSESQTIYLKMADAMGLPTIKILDYTIREDTPPARNIPPQSGYATKDDLDMLREEIVELKGRFKEGGMAL